jgi:DNA processing protein
MRGIETRKYWVGFNLVKGIGAVRLQALLDHFGDIRMAWEAPADVLMAAGLGAKQVENLVAVRRQVDLDQVLIRIDNQGIQVLTWDDDLYPSRLKEIGQPPPVLYVRGELIPDDQWAVAVVGTRRMTPYGRQVAEEVCTYLAQQGITVVSGLARGIDAIAHQAVLKAGGRTLAVLGSGVDVIYPPEHARLADQIIGQGALISDYAPGTQPEGINFPPRNRIISGMTLATVVVEASDKSGALITATFAAEQGREVFAVPGSILAPQSKGTNRLIQNGAHPLLTPSDISDELNLIHVPEKQSARRTLPIDATEALLLGYITHQPIHIDDLCDLSKMAVEQVSATLTMLELKGLVNQVGGMMYVAVRETGGEYNALNGE